MSDPEPGQTRSRASQAQHVEAHEGMVGHLIPPAPAVRTHHGVGGDEIGPANEHLHPSIAISAAVTKAGWSERLACSQAGPHEFAILSHGLSCTCMLEVQVGILNLAVLCLQSIRHLVLQSRTALCLPSGR